MQNCLINENLYKRTCNPNINILYPTYSWHYHIVIVHSSSRKWRVIKGYKRLRFETVLNYKITSYEIMQNCCCKIVGELNFLRVENFYFATIFISYVNRNISCNLPMAMFYEVINFSIKNEFIARIVKFDALEFLMQIG